MKRVLIKGLIILIRLYQKVLSPLWPGRCRFYPTCSEYFCQSLQKWGLTKGIWKGVARLGKCHPFHPGGYDPV